MEPPARARNHLNPECTKKVVTPRWGSVCQPFSAQMPKISAIIQEKGQHPYVAFEYFPPRTADGVAALQKRFVRMASQGA